MIWTLIVGLVVGVIAKIMMPGKDPGGFVITMMLGILGAFAANFIGTGLGWYTQDEPVGLVASVVGSVLILAIYRAATGNRQLTHRH